MAAPVDRSPKQRALDLLLSNRLHGEQLDLYVERALAPHYWKALAPELSIEESPVADVSDAADVDVAASERMVRRFAEEGYLQIDGILRAPVVERMRMAAMRLIEADWPPVFAWMYDEFWRASRSAPLRQLFSHILGKRYRQTPFVWTHVVASQRGAAGWRPHVDNPGDVFRLTVWIPLTDATLDSGSMSLVPRHLEPVSAGARWYDRASLSMSEVRALLHASRPLPVRAGSVLAWDASLMHWGSPRQTSGPPRVSLSLELVSATADPAVLDGALEADDGSLPTYNQRLRIVAEGISLYEASEPRASRYAPLSARLLRHLGAQ